MVVTCFVATDYGALPKVPQAWLPARECVCGGAGASEKRTRGGWWLLAGARFFVVADLLESFGRPSQGRRYDSPAGSHHIASTSISIDLNNPEVCPGQPVEDRGREVSACRVPLSS